MNSIATAGSISRAHRARAVGERRIESLPEQPGENGTDEEHANPSEIAETFAAFDRWLEKYVTGTNETGREAIEREGLVLAAKRRAALSQLIETDPQRALDLTVPFRTRQLLPASVTQQLEEHVSGVARFDVVAAVPGNDSGARIAPIERFVTMNNRTFKAFVYGRRIRQMSMAALPLHGIVLDEKMAVHEDPVRVLEPAEAEDPSLPPASGGGHCPISQAPGTSAAAVEVGGEVFYLCHAGHIEAFNKVLSAAESGNSKAYASRGDQRVDPARTHGAKTALVMRVIFPDDRQESITEAEAAELMRGVNAFFVENSYSAMSVTATITPPLLLPQPKTWYAQADQNFSILYALLDDARNAAQAAGYDFSQYDLDCVHLRPNIISTSRGLVGRPGAWLMEKTPLYACHEFGHNLGLSHANGWKTSDGSPIGSGTNQEYGNPYDTMGGPLHGETWQYNLCYKDKLGWIPEAAIQEVTSDGIYRLYPFDVPALADGLLYGLRIGKDDDREYWIETRQAAGIGNLLLNWGPWNQSNQGSQLLDMNPGEGGFFDAALPLGRSFYDPDLGLKITPLRLTGTTPESVDVLVEHVHYLAFEAESANAADGTTVVADPSSSGGRSLDLSSAEGAADFNLDIPATGDYVIWCRVRFPGIGPVSLLLSVDADRPNAEPQWEKTASNNWQWNRLVERVSGLPKAFSLSAGTHVIHLRSAGQKVQIDALLVTDNADSTPPPLIGKISDQVIPLGAPAAVIPLTLAEMDSRSSVLKLTATSSNGALVGPSDMRFDGDGITRHMTVTPRPGQLGNTTITVTFSRGGGEWSSTRFSFTVIGVVQSLVNAAAPGETVLVPPGNYLETLVIDKDLTLQGANTAQTIIEGDKLNPALTIASNVNVTIRDLTVQNGRGGVRNYGMATLIECAIRDNVAAGKGGGIWNASAASLVLGSSTVSSNRSPAGGGGIYNEGVFTLFNSTVSGNRAFGSAAGGGIENSGTFFAQASTIARNRSGRGGGLANVGTAQIGSSILAGNVADSGAGPDMQGELTSTGYNLIQNRTGLVGDLSRDIVGQDPRLGPLQNNGGPTLTHALLPDSPAIDQGSAADLTTDQRGAVRPLLLREAGRADDGADIGAFEFVPEPVRQLSASLAPGEQPNTVVVRIALAAHGDENAVEFSLAYAGDSLRNARAALAPDAKDAVLTFASDSATGAAREGNVRVRVALPTGAAFSAGAHDVAVIEFESLIEPANVSSEMIHFSDQTGGLAISTVGGQVVSIASARGSSAIGVEPRLILRPGANGEITVILQNGAEHSWIIEASNDLVTWERVATLWNVMGPAQFTDAIAREAGHRFYRAVVY